MTYRQLAVRLAEMEDNELDQDVAVLTRNPHDCFFIDALKSVGDLDEFLPEGYPALISRKETT